MYFDKAGRHYWFAENLIDSGYKPTIFCASTNHFSNNNVDTKGEKYIQKTVNEIPFVFVNTPNYKGNGSKRIFNMIAFYRNLFSVSKHYSGLNSKPDIILASSVHPLTLVAGIRIAKKFGTPCICEVRDLWPEAIFTFDKVREKSLLGKILTTGEHWIYRKADALIFTKEGDTDYIKERKWDTAQGGDIDLEKTHYINNGIDIDEFNDNKEKHIYNDIDLNNKDTFKILYTGSMGKANELIYVIKTAERIKELGINDIKFILFGDGYQREELEEYAKNNGLGNVIFKGKVEKKYIPNILSKSNLNIFTGKYIYLYKYGLSLNKMFDYFASGKPTLSNIECGYDMLEKYDCGITVGGGSSEDLAEGVLKFYNMPRDGYNRYCRNALKAAEDFDFKLLTDKLEKIILELCPTKEGETYANTID